MLRTYRDRAIVLRAYKLGEADRIQVLLGRQSGQIRAVAKGVRRTSSRFGSRLGSFNLVDIQCHRGSGLHTITQVETVSAYSDRLAHNYAAFTNAKVVVETAQKLTEGLEEPVPEQFDLLHGALHALAAGAHAPELIAASYLLRAMSLAGWSPSLQACVACGATTDLAFFSVASGGVICSACGADSVDAATPEVLTLLSALADGDWAVADVMASDLGMEASRLAGRWASWHLEQRLRALPFATTGGF